MNSALCHKYVADDPSGEPSLTTTVDAPASDTGSSALINALIGGVAGIILSFIPFSTILGGAIAGYLEGGESSNGLKVGAIAGVIMLIPFVLMGMFFLTWMLGLGGTPAAFGMVFGAIYTVGMSVVGGYLGIYLKTNSNRHSRRSFY